MGNATSCLRGPKPRGEGPSGSTAEPNSSKAIGLEDVVLQTKAPNVDQITSSTATNVDCKADITAGSGKQAAPPAPAEPSSSSGEQGSQESSVAPTPSAEKEASGKLAKCDSEPPSSVIAAKEPAGATTESNNTGLQKLENGAFASTNLDDVAPEIAPSLGLPYQVHMCGPPPPPCNDERLQTVRALNAVTPVLDPELLEAPPDPELNTILKLVASIFQTPAALVALFDDKRIFIRDSEGAFQRGDFPWRWSFCGWTMASKNDQIMVIPDATKDARFCENHAVKDLGVRFYCGTPLIASNGHRLGTLCFADFKPRPFDAASAHILNNLSELVVRHIEKDIALQVRQHSNTQLSEAYRNLRRTVDCFEHCVALVDTRITGWRFMYTNLAWNKTAGLERERMQGQLVSDVFTLPGGAPLPGPAHERHADAMEEFIIPGARFKLLPSSGNNSAASNVTGSANTSKSATSGSTASASLASTVASVSSATNSRGSTAASSVTHSGNKAYVLKFRPASKDDLDEGVLPIGIPSFIPRDTTVATELNTERFYFVTMEDASKSTAGSRARNSCALSSASWATMDTPESIQGLKMGLLLGKGGYGSVYHATLFGTPVAVKILEQDIPQPADGSVPPLPNEVLLSQELRHPHIVATLKCATRRMPPRGYYGASQAGLSSAMGSMHNSACGNALGGGSGWDNINASEAASAGVSGSQLAAGAKVQGFPSEPASGDKNAVAPASASGLVHAPLAQVEEESASNVGVQKDGASAGNHGDGNNLGWAVFDMEEVREYGLEDGVGNSAMPANVNTSGAVHSPFKAAGGPGGMTDNYAGANSEMAWGGESQCMLHVDAATAGGVPSAGGGGKLGRVSELASQRSSNATGCGRMEVTPMIPMQTWIVMEFCDKGCLQDAVDRGWLRHNLGMSSEPNMQAVLATAREIASALSFMHARDIIHGDLSAWNVMLCTTGAATSLGGRGFAAKVADFGLSRMVDVRTKIQTQTYGTLTHMPPEALKDGVISKAVDVYSFGVLLWQMFTGSRPWAGLSHGQIIYMVAAQHAQLKLPARTPMAYADLARSCMAVKAEDRPSFDSIVAAIEAMAEDYTIN